MLTILFNIVVVFLIEFNILNNFVFLIFCLCTMYICMYIKKYVGVISQFVQRKWEYSVKGVNPFLYK